MFTAIENREVVIGDHNSHMKDVVDFKGPDGKKRSKGLVQRDWKRHPAGSYRAAPYKSIDMPLIDQSEWVQRATDLEQQKARLSDIRMRGNGGQPFPSLDQDGVGYCFVKDTPVILSNGHSVPIQDVRQGDRVLTSAGHDPVSKLYEKDYDGDLITLEVDGIDGKLVCTGDHPIYEGDTSAYPYPTVKKAARELTAGSLVWTADGNRPVKSVIPTMVSGHKVYDIEVANLHRYYANRVLVSNCWAHSSTHSNMYLRAVANLPYVPLSAFAVAATIKNGADEGGWGAQSLDFLMSKGQPSQQLWPQGDRNYRAYQNRQDVWTNAALHKITEGWIDMAVEEYDRKMTYAQVITCVLLRIPVVVDFNWWSHSVCAVDAVAGQSLYGKLRARSGKVVRSIRLFDAAVGMNDPVTAGVNLRIQNSWSDSWSDRGMGVLTGQKAVPDGAVAPRVTLASAA